MLILGSGPNRIGQGIEFDYSCVHAVMALRAAGYETVMINCNPETVSTDYDTADRLYFEPLTFEDVLEVVHAEQQSGTVAGVICTLGGQTPLGLAAAAQAGRGAGAGHPARGDRPGRGPRRVRPGAGRGRPARAQARPGDVVRAGQGGGRRDRLPGAGPAVLRARRAGHGDRLRRGRAWPTYIAKATDIAADHPVLVDRFLDDSVEIDVDALYDGTELYLGGVMEHIEEAGIHSGDSACALPPITLGAATDRPGPGGHPARSPRASGCAGC